MFVNVYSGKQTKIMAAPIGTHMGLHYVLECAKEAPNRLKKPDYDVFTTREAAVSAALARKKEA